MDITRIPIKTDTATVAFAPNAPVRACSREGWSARAVTRILVVLLSVAVSACTDSGASLDSGASVGSSGGSSSGGSGGTTSVPELGTGPTSVGDNNSAPESSGVVDLGTDNRQAARFLTQATFGPTMESLEEFRNLGADAWLDRQFSLPVSGIYDYTRANSNGSGRDSRHEAWWNNALDREDQLRQRMTFALSQIFVISDLDKALSNRQYGVADYYDMLARNAFGNYRQLLEEVTLHPVMGVYLTHIRSEKANPELNIRPDENYAREVLQLFSVGLNQLQLDGSQILADGRPVPVYSQLTVEEFARVFTGWNYTGVSWTATNIPNQSFIDPMSPVDEFHDFGEKILLDGAVVPAGLSPREDLAAALDNIFQHPNVGPFFGKLLIQRLVTSNPSPAYVQRVASVFNDNGAGERGDLGAVLEAVLMDPEARNDPGNNPVYGKIREPLIKLAHFFRAFNAFPGPEANGVHRTASFALERLDEMTGQAPLRSPSVFNFFQSDTPLSPADSLVAPELQIMTEANFANTHINFHYQVYRFTTRANLNDDNPRATLIDIEPLVDLAANTSDLLDWLDLVFFSGAMPQELRDNIQITLSEIDGGSDAGRFARAQDALFLATSAPAFSIQR